MSLCGSTVATVITVFKVERTSNESGRCTHEVKCLTIVQSFQTSGLCNLRPLLSKTARHFIDTGFEMRWNHCCILTVLVCSCEIASAGPTQCTINCKFTRT
ncbi:uncharacterized protein YALI1_E35095g [Yarrowia lipolytica]|uniref:Uncharacterized protein n=1 Tax=Yarrowia lipolytica TaxID=4952 RepID=A0A1D8NKI5_YARLL|nr:hypothetical protein YALI1_E35095g [Yarrowia lipolytica]